MKNPPPVSRRGPDGCDAVHMPVICPTCQNVFAGAKHRSRVVTGYFAWGCFRYFIGGGCGVAAGRMTPRQNRHAGSGSIAVAPEKSSVAKSRGSGLSRAVQPARALDNLRQFVYCLFRPTPIARGVSRMSRTRGGLLRWTTRGAPDDGIPGGRQKPVVRTPRMLE